LALRGIGMKAGKSPPDPNQEAIPSDLVQVQLERIIASSAFDASRRNRAFLRFIVEESLAGRADGIKAYTIVTSVLGRDDSFDPQSDPIVRIEANRLRGSLERYYLMAGQDDPIRIDIPKWRYVPSLRRVHSARDQSTPPRHSPALQAFEEEPSLLAPGSGRRPAISDF
jgi:adenylate cyclase